MYCRRVTSHVLYELFRKALYACAVPYMLWELVLSSCRSDNCHVVSCEFCELFLKALFTCVFQVELIKVSTLRGPCLACNMLVPKTGEKGWGGGWGGGKNFTCSKDFDL